MKENKFYVIGGQYESICYGGRPTLIGAKRLANRFPEHWDNWQGTHIPQIYRAEDTHVIEARGMVCYRDGQEIRVKKFGAEPIA